MTLYKVRAGSNDGGVEEHDVHAENQQDAILITGRRLSGAHLYRVLTVTPVPCECCCSMGTLRALSSDDWREAYWKAREKANALREDIRAYVKTEKKLREEGAALVRSLKVQLETALQAIERVERGELAPVGDR